MTLPHLDHAGAQDFEAAAPPGPSRSTLTFIEQGVGEAGGGLRFESGWIGRHRLPELATRAASVGLDVRALRFAVGASNTGDREIGWSALGAALGVAREGGGAAVRAVIRHADEGAPSVLGRGLGVEAGAGAWVSAGSVLRLWASAPQLWTRGAAPPLSRALETGLIGTLDGLSLWISRRAPALVRAQSTYRAGIAVVSGPLEAWVEARDRPLRGVLGVRAWAGGLAVGGAVESHPVLGESIRLTVGAGGGRRQ